jgi:predicted nucleic acid-binding protein
LVAFLDRAEQHHRWVTEQVEELETPLLVCEPVLAEAMYLLARFQRADGNHKHRGRGVARSRRLDLGNDPALEPDIVGLRVAASPVSQ